MKVHELIAQLSRVPQDAEVILSSDSEGNRYDTAFEVDVARYQSADDEFWPIHPQDLADYDIEDTLVGVYIWP